ncbi:heparan-alpha-glucosaminide N-acetyltransferase domain-containing protein [Capnocytophaga leadbetteri]|uniref:heparan-alpha-glucosaminide N-acetyltransferase domain-containing protein n=1 Tax=Capnocytophaga leadbetteri TaxID=327575 RepID=UPI0028D8EFFE|nr:heparan-alpha-glucosaminide N-acetyltransferase domain-containing protein [Capnocytophaga leadbetteri]
MENVKKFRLDFIDVIRAFAICMMLQGHFVGGLLADRYRDDNNFIYWLWHYCTGITAPVFFTVSGFIFTFLLVKESDATKIGWQNPRVKKGIRRGLMLIGIAYFLRMSFQSVDVLHCIGLSLLLLITTYLLSYNRKAWVMPTILLSTTLLAFTFEPFYKSLTFDFLPLPIANYFTRAHGSFFPIFPWFGYVAFGGFMGYLFQRYKAHPHLYRNAILLFLTVGAFLLWASHYIVEQLYYINHATFFARLMEDFAYLRLGNVLLVFGFFALMRNVITSKLIKTIGQNTLSIYVIHCFVLYGSITSHGLLQHFGGSLKPYQVVLGAPAFIAVCVWLSFIYNRVKPVIKSGIGFALKEIRAFLVESYQFIIRLVFSRQYNK